MGTPTILKRLVPGRLLRHLVPRSLLGRLLLIIIIPLVVLISLSSFIFYERHWETVARQLALSLAGEVRTLIALRTTYTHPEDQMFIRSLAQTEMQIGMTLEPDVRLADLPRLSKKRDLINSTFGQALQERLTYPFCLEELEREINLDIEIQEGIIHITVPRKRVFSSTTYIFIIWMVGISLLVSTLAILFIRNQVRPIRHLAVATHLFGKGREVPNFKPEGAAEIRQAGQAFTLMRERIRRQIEQRTEMLAGVSHDLRTPLTRMKLQLALLGSGEGIAELKEDVAEMERMIEGYLAFARGAGTETIRPASLTDLLDDIIGRIRRHGGAIGLHIEQAITLPLRVNAMERCLSNLVGNAVRYAEYVAVRVGRRGEAIDIIIDDDGPGIPPDKREEVFKAFYRLESSRNQATGGVGLGLTVARDIARSHGGDVLLADRP
ncbi:MAG: two-component system OmpR family osmolarity sensor histidine kinase EnvZ, partial [Rhodospirillaceae bacterium]